MRKLADSEFKEQLEQRVNAAAVAIKKIAELADRRPDLMGDQRIEMVETYLSNQLAGLNLALDAVRTRRTSAEGFSLDTAIEPAVARTRATVPAAGAKKTAPGTVRLIGSLKPSDGTPGPSEHDAAFITE